MDSAATTFNDEDSSESDHNASLHIALSRCVRGDSWVSDIWMRAQRCMDYLRAGVGFKPGVQVSSYFICELAWGKFDFMNELFDAYVAAGHMRLNERQTFPSGAQAVPLEAAILNGNLSAVHACLRHGPIPSAPTQPWAAKDGSIVQALEDLADLGCRPALREHIRTAITTALARQHALHTEQAMLNVIARSAPATHPGITRRRVRAGL